MERIVVYTDGSCYPNPNGFGGWAFTVTKINEDSTVEDIGHRSGAENNSTNNRAEFLAVIEATRWLKENLDAPHATIITDSLVAIAWAKDSCCSHKDLQRLWAQCKYGDLKFDWVKGHSDNKWNALCDAEANKARERLTVAYKKIPSQ